MNCYVLEKYKFVICDWKKKLIRLNFLDNFRICYSFIFFLVWYELLGKLNIFDYFKVVLYMFDGLNWNKGMVRNK